MSTKNIIMSMTFLSLILASGASGDPVLLASYDYHIDCGSAPLDISQVEFILQLAVDQWEPHPEINALGSNIFWADGEQGSVIFNKHNSTTFADFAIHATNNIDEIAELWNLDVRGSGAIMPLNESILFQTHCDLAGSNLDYAQLTVHSLSFSDFEPFPGERGFRYASDITWSFYGTPIPEPAMGMMLLLLMCLKFWYSRGW